MHCDRVNAQPTMLRHYLDETSWMNLIGMLVKSETACVLGRGKAILIPIM